MFEGSKSERIVNHLGEIIKGRYGRDLEIVRLMNLRSSESAFLTEQMGEELHIPLSHGDLFLGKAVLRGTSELSSLDVDRASETVKLALEPVLYGEYLNLQNTNQEVQLKYKELDIRPIFLKVIDQKKGLDFEQNDSKNEIDNQKPELRHSVLFIEGKSYEFARRVAQDIHEQSRSWSFVELKDLIRDFSQNLSQNLTEIESLSNSTIFIAATEAQLPEVQEWLLHLSKVNSSTDLLVLVHRESYSQGVSLRPAQSLSQVSTFFLDKVLGVPVISAERLPAHRLLRIETIQMMFDFPALVSHD
jgi:hypothetical protein